MNPEKEIIIWWLNKQGFFTVNSIPASGNKEVDILAIKHKGGKPSEVIHLESSCSISQDNLKPEDYKNKFDDKAIIKTVKKIIKDNVGSEIDYKKMLVVCFTRVEDFSKLGNITVIKFEDIISEVFQSLTKQYFRNPTMRTLQLVKYVMLASPKKLAAIVEDDSANKVLKQNTREDFLKVLMKQKEVKRVLDKTSFEKELIDILRHSSLNKPERLAKIISEDILTSRNRNKFLKILFEQKSIKKEIKPKRKDQSLMAFVKSL